MESSNGRKPLFERLKTGMEEGIRHAKGEIALKTTTLEIPGRAPEVGAEELPCPSHFISLSPVILYS